MKKMKTIEKRENEILALGNFEEVLENLIAVHFNEDTIEIPGVVILKRANSGSLLSKILNADLEVIDIDTEVFDSMIATIRTSEIENKLIFKSATKPEKDIVLNLAELKKLAVFVKITDTAIFVNNFIFTNDKIEFHGEGMFTSRRVYFLKDLSPIKNLFEIE